MLTSVNSGSGNLKSAEISPQTPGINSMIEGFWTCSNLPEYPDAWYQPNFGLSYKSQFFQPPQNSLSVWGYPSGLVQFSTVSILIFRESIIGL